MVFEIKTSYLDETTKPFVVEGNLTEFGALFSNIKILSAEHMFMNTISLGFVSPTALQPFCCQVKPEHNSLY